SEEVAAMQNKLAWLRPLLIGVLIALLLAGCGSPADTTAGGPSPDPAGSLAADPVPEGSTGAAAGRGWPREVTESYGVTVVIAADSQRAIYLSLRLDDVVMALAGPERSAATSEVARSAYRNIAAQAQQAPETVTGDLEHDLGLNPDLLPLDGFAQP